MLLLVCVPAAVGQNSNKDEMYKKLKEFKLKFLAQELSLSEKQQTPFFEIYSEMMDEKRKVWKPTRQLERKVKEDKNASDSDYRLLSEAMNKSKSAEAEIDERYEARFRTVLTGKQLFQLRDAENKFREKIREMRSVKKHKSRKK